MEVVIIEDEILTAEDLAGILLKLPYHIKVVKILATVKESIEYFKENKKIDLLFCDIELGDGHSFEIFKQVSLSIPVIFCTAYNEYALEAFENNGIGYILKPFTKKAIKEAVDKFVHLKANTARPGDDITQLLSLIQKASNFEKKNSSILVNWKDKILPIKYTDIALFGLDYKSTFLINMENQKHVINYNLDELGELCDDSFYRANRQYLINKNAVDEVLQYSNRKLFVKLKIKGDFDIIIAKAKVPEFLSWLRI